MGFFTADKSSLPTEESALPGRSTRPFAVGDRHLVLGNPIESEAPVGFEVAVFGLGCFWGEEKTFWEIPGVWSTSVGYAGGITPNPTYEEVCTGRTGHAEVVRVVFDPSVVTYADLLQTFWENHDPTQGMRQGNDMGTQYRSAIYTDSEEQAQTAKEIIEAYQPVLTERGYGPITTEVKPVPPYYYADAFHQQYLAKNPDGYRCHAATGIKVPE